MLVVLVALMVLFFSFQSLFTRLYSAHYAGPDAGQSKSVFSICYGVFICYGVAECGRLFLCAIVADVAFGLAQRGHVNYVQHIHH